MALGPVCFAQEWELGVVAGYGVHRDVTVTNASGSAKAGFKPGLAAGAVAGHNMYPYLSGEMRYTYRFSDLRVKGNGQEAAFKGESHAVHYDLLYLPGDADSAIRPFVAGGGGIMFYRGTGKEVVYQPLNKFALLTKTQEVEPLISVGGGVKAKLSDRVILRLEFRDYITTVPKNVLAPAPGAKMKGWLHDFLPMAGITIGF